MQWQVALCEPDKSGQARGFPDIPTKEHPQSQRHKQRNRMHVTLLEAAVQQNTEQSLKNKPSADPVKHPATLGT